MNISIILPYDPQLKTPSTPRRPAEAQGVSAASAAAAHPSRSWRLRRSGWKDRDPHGIDMERCV